jgi:DNA-binding CsgD family transcriptional regulator
MGRPPFKQGIRAERDMVAGNVDKKLSPMQKRVLDLLAEGLQPHQIASQLDRGVSTIGTHIKRAREILGAKSTVAAAVKWALLKNYADAEYRSWT